MAMSGYNPGMRFILSAGLLAGIVTLALFPVAPQLRAVWPAIAASWPAEVDGPPTVVELFTSQGCSSCPPADALLAELAGRRDVVAIAYHVTYWDYLGWKDPFATRWGTERQSRYVRALGLNTRYTPQMVVDGTVDVVGSRRNAVAGALAASREVAAGRVDIALSRDSATGALLVHLPPQQIQGTAELLLIRYAGSRETEVLRGENRGRTLTNTHIAREMRHLGSWTGATLDLRVPVAQDPDDGGYAVLLQERTAGRIIGAAKLLPGS